MDSKKPLQKPLQKLLAAVGITGIVYAIGYFVETSHFRMLGVQVQVLDPINLFSSVGDFLYNTIRITLTLIKFLPNIIILTGIIIITIFAVVSKRANWIIQLLIMVILVAWSVTFLIPLMDFDNLLMSPGNVEYSGSKLLYFGPIMLENLLIGNSYMLESYYTYHLLVLILGLITVFLISKNYSEQPGKKLLDMCKFETIRQDPKLIINIIVLVFTVINLIFLPIAYGVLAKQPNFPNVIVIIDPTNVEYDDIFGLNERFKYGRNNYLIHQDASNTCLFSIETRELTVINTSAIYALVHLSKSEPKSILSLIQRK